MDGNGQIGKAFVPNEVVMDIQPPMYRGRSLMMAAPMCDASCVAPRICVSTNVCICPSPQVYDATTMTCANPYAVIFIRIHFITIRFIPGMANSASTDFQTLQSSFISSIYLILVTDVIASGVVIDIHILRFLPGSVIVEAELVLKENSNVTLAYLKNIIEKGLRNPPTHAPLNFTNSRLDDMRDDDVCDSTYNMCGENAYCISQGKKFIECQCNKGYENVLARHNPFTKEIQCEEICKPTECSNRGYCDIQNGEKRCNCYIWYLGHKCQFNGINILLVLIGVIGLLLFIGVITLIAFSKRRYGKSLYERWSPFKIDSKHIWPFSNNDSEKDGLSIKSSTINLVCVR
ncbi:mucin-12-like [Gordionus sp. m RMFG-2023]|uniref:mucin-12-like n=1 Tax=Gordionus sp. m RMFG-2023 TaxID=3053472 RepID=UPI0031FD27B4